MSCTQRPPPKGYRCTDCWQCMKPPNAKYGKCQQTQAVSPDSQPVRTCHEIAANNYSNKKECEANCSLSTGVTCYMCNIQPGEKYGQCETIHPTDQNGNPLQECPNWPNVFPTMEECRTKCTQSGPIKPVAKCWSATGPGSCKCVLGDAEGPNGPLSSCEGNLGFYDTQNACVKACKSPSSDKTIWIIIGVSAGVLVLLIIVALVIYFLWKKRKSE